MTNIEQFTQQLMLAHDIGFHEAKGRAEEFYKMLENETPSVLNGWIDAKQQPFLSGEIFLFCTLSGYVAMGELCGEEYIVEINDNIGGTPVTDVTHWRPLPEPPHK